MSAKGTQAQLGSQNDAHSSNEHSLAQVPAHLLRALITSINSLHSEVAHANPVSHHELPGLPSNEQVNERILSNIQTLVPSIDDLRTKFVQHCKENSMFRRNPDTIDRIFHLFPKLPEEIRNIVWDFAIRVPQIHIIWPGEGKISRSKITNVIQACSEARCRILALQLPYYQMPLPETNW
jgi:hypothetical protein